ncbi:hypothetical protein FTX61_06780 [Nitriliruptoraceae bacterium ZYF776]|nr:hypothetical protein [Profundirhabdus halotolerans]
MAHGPIGPTAGDRTLVRRPAVRARTVTRLLGTRADRRSGEGRQRCTAKQVGRERVRRVADAVGRVRPGGGRPRGWPTASR